MVKQKSWHLTPTVIASSGFSSMSLHSRLRHSALHQRQNGSGLRTSARHQHDAHHCPPRDGDACSLRCLATTRLEARGTLCALCAATSRRDHKAAGGRKASGKGGENTVAHSKPEDHKKVTSLYKAGATLLLALHTAGE